MIIKTITIALLTGAISTCMGTVDGEVEIDSGPEVTRSITVEEDFDRVAVASSYEVTVVPGDTLAIEATGPENVLERTQFAFSDGRLSIRPEKSGNKIISWSNGGEAQIRITMPRINEGAVAGSAELTIEEVTSDDFIGKVAGSGELEIARMEATKARFGIAGSGEASASGSVDALSVSVAGSGEFDNPGLTARTAVIKVAGSGNIGANVTETADIRAAGSGDVRVTGGAKCTVRRAGSADVDCS